ncbi:hypothetical protein HN014_17435 [Aquimarina sp. TRL1]|uniref:2-dehydropantoate 2-reductase N-terminal domain-containing protein n=1 Tax=Aquimarina sp. (strain TRL1) TaxID=2736252 RepID=UPI00158CF881|nr:2-dehydropantoate 2-reductase N-terminal domain-containing protein [Aquimarina sp. TRL1]QKX06621.1 hypothetical protein HN014_17435 [Aquimarina sp. TRL1]
MSYKVGILGVGAIGTLMASLLYPNKKLSLFLYNRSPKQQLSIFNDKKEKKIPIHVETSLPEKRKLDFLCICLKEHQVKNAHTFLTGLIGVETKVIVIRNGIHHKEALLPYTSERNIIEAVIDCPVQPIADGRYEQLNKPVLIINRTAFSELFISLFSPADIKINCILDIKTIAWKKLCESAALGAILCLAGESCWIFKDQRLVNLHKKLLQEGVQVAIADGAEIKEPIFIEAIQTKLVNYPPEKGSSMLSDRKRGAPIELGAKNQVISSLGKQYAIETPIHDLVCMLLEKTNNNPTS